MVYIRGNDRDFNRWETLGNSGWDYRDVLRYFKKSECNQNQGLNPMYHNFDGKLPVADFNDTDPITDILIAAAEECGIKQLDDLNADEYLGYGFAQGTVYDGRRVTTAKAFLTPASRRPNLDVITNATVSEIIIKHKRVVGVRFILNGKHELVARNRKDVILSAGAIRTPQILMLSGIGPRGHLESLGITVACDLPVGLGLHDHPSVPLFLKFLPTDSDLTPDEQMMQSFVEFVVNNTGPFTGIGSENLNMFINTKKNSKYPDIQVTYFKFDHNTTDFETFVAQFGLVEPAKTALVKESKTHDIVIVIIACLRPKSRGKVSLRTRSIHDPPNIDNNWLEHDYDLDTLVRGIKYQVALTTSQAYRINELEYIWPPLPACDSLFSQNKNKYYACYARQLTASFWHPVGTCKMSPQSDGVVDYRLRVKGIGKLRVIDASIMPEIVSANTNAAVIMIAEKGADFIKFDWSHIRSKRYRF